jgi:hypothetical protein
MPPKINPASMKTCCLFVREDLAAMGNRFFEQPEINGMKSDTYMYKDLKNFLATKNIDLNVQSIHKPEESDLIICLNETGYFTSYRRNERNKQLLLIITEPPVYNMNDWSKSRHVFFDKVFTYDPGLVKSDPSKYVLIHFPIDLSVPVAGLPTEKEFNKKKLASLVAGAFAITKPAIKNNSLLFERYRVLKWYQKHDPLSLHFFARVHPVNKFEHFRGASYLNKISKKITSAIAKVLFEKRIAGIYKGPISGLSKNEAMRQYKFNFCLENSYGIKGLISEKIFDCFAAGTVPVYLGAPDISDYIPTNCYVLYSDYKSLGELNTFLHRMDYNTYIQYLINAGDFLNSPKAAVFSTAEFIDKIYSVIRS